MRSSSAYGYSSQTFKVSATIMTDQAAGGLDGSGRLGGFDSGLCFRMLSE